MLHLLRFVPFAIVLVWLKYARNIVLQTYLYNHIKYLGGILKTTGRGGWGWPKVHTGLRHPGHVNAEFCDNKNNSTEWLDMNTQMKHD